MRPFHFLPLAFLISLLLFVACKERSGRVRIVFSADTWGELEDCGCGSQPSGGLARRANALFRLRGAGGALLLVDGGNIHSGLDTEGALRLSRETVSLMGLMRYDLAVLGPRDAGLKSGTVRQLLADAAFPWLGGSWRKGRQALGLDSAWVKEAGGLVVGVLDHVDAEYAGNRKIAGHVEDRLLERVRLLRPYCDVLVVVAAVDPRAPEPLARRLAGQVDLLLVTGGATATTEAQDVGGVLVASVGEKGGALGQLEVEVERGRQRLRRWSLLPLDGAFREDSLVADRVMRAKDVERAYESLRREQARQQKLRELGLKAVDLPGEDAGARYAGASTCLACHGDQYDAWRTSAHASAFAPLLREGRDGDFAARRAVTGWMEKSGWLSHAETPELDGVQCEACHGRGSRHVKSGGRLVDDLAPDPAAACLRCHPAPAPVEPHGLEAQE